MRPTDGDALNNHGFCLLPTAPHEALHLLQRASLYPLKQKTINAANRSLALYLVGRREDAVTLAKESLALPPPHHPEPCYAWKQDLETGALHLENVQSARVHLEQLLKFLDA